MTSNCIREASREVLGVSKGYTSNHMGDWWWNVEVQGKVEEKKGAYRRLVESTEDEDRRMNRERYKEARKLAKLAVTEAKNTAFGHLYEELGQRQGQEVVPTGQSEREDGSTKEMLEDCRWSTMIPQYKNKGDIQNCTNYMGIKLLSHTMKVWERVVKARVKRLVSISDNQFRFMPGRSTMEAIHLIRRLVELYRDRKKNLHMVFIDLEKAYNKVPNGGPLEMPGGERCSGSVY
ncbi:uncharacterized protein LOC142180398 [Nicotiana tabacum]|uniref:Uncharacterized protein LOC142180398 n=1 Tax=Nicotiana tabacum TaxID=4097 RepID=A0AC58UGV2_TOBAC